jgi:hypothetical protein
MVVGSHWRTFEQVCSMLPDYFIFIYEPISCADDTMLYLIADNKVCAMSYDQIHVITC